MPLRPRHGYAAGIHRDLPASDINQPGSSPPVMKGRGRTAIQPVSTGFELAESS
jgi:hypothetical protein